MFWINVDLASVLDMCEELEPKLKKALSDAARDLSVQTHAHIVEEVQRKLHSSRDKYTKALHFEQVTPETWVISLDESAMWIEEGMDQHEMIDNLTSSPKAKTAKDGSKYVVVPFEHKKGPTKQTSAQTDLTNTIKQEMQKRKIPYAGIETDAEGKPKIGKLHSFDILKEPVKTGNGPGQGHGAIGAVRQGNTGTPFLQGVRVYQKMVGDKPQRSIMTFRVASTKQKGSGKWVHPGLIAKKFFDDAALWALDLWEHKIAPDIISRFK